MSLKIGEKAPNFSLFNTEKQKVSLSDLKGQNVLLLFFPLAFTGVCTAELCNIRDGIADYNNLDCKVIGVSVDSIFTLEKFKNEQNLNFDLISDFNKEASKDYFALYNEFVFEMKGVSKRSAFIIDKDGLLQYIEVLEDAGSLPNFELIKQKLSELS